MAKKRNGRLNKFNECSREYSSKYSIEYSEREVTYYDKSNDIKPLKPTTKNQQLAFNALNNPEKKVIFLTGCARTGKTYLPTCFASDQLKEGKIKKIVLTRPIVEAGEKIGFLKGSLEEKMCPYIRPARDIFEHRLGYSQTKAFINNNIIEGIPLGFMRSITLNNTFIIFDEAQNVNLNQMELVITRLGENSRIVICGDYKRQTDIKERSGLADVVKILKNRPYVAHIDFGLEDIYFDVVRDIVTEFYYYQE